MKVWVTKYALTAGISVGEYEVGPAWPDRDGSAVYAHVDNWKMHRMGRDAFDNEADAISDAERRRDEKISSLRKQIAKLEKLTF